MTFAPRSLFGRNVLLIVSLIVLAQIHKFKGGDDRVDYFVREYFALEHGRY